MSSPARPALAEVLAAMTGQGLSWWHYQIDGGWTAAGLGPVKWRHATPAEALESLATAGLWPWTPGDGPRWWCDGCEGSGLAAVDTSRGRRFYRCGECDSAGHTADPPSHAALVAVTSLSAPTLTRAAELAAEIARRAGCEGATLVWRVMSREAIIDAHRSNAKTRRDVVGTFGNEASLASVIERHDVVLTPWPAIPPRYDDASIAAWPALRDLHALGVHLVALDAQRIVLAVEAIGGYRG